MTEVDMSNEASLSSAIYVILSQVMKGLCILHDSEVAKRVDINAKEEIASMEEECKKATGVTE